MKNLILLIGTMLFLIPMQPRADEIMLVGGQIDFVPSYNGDDGMLHDNTNGICDVDDNRDNIPNGPREGLCRQNPDNCTVFPTRCTMDSLCCDCLQNQEIDPCW